MLTFSNQGVSVAKGVVHDDICYMNDKCWPNPCQNGGICKQTSTDFQCECEGRVIYPKYYKKYDYALAHEMSFVRFSLFWPRKVHFKAKI